MDLPDSATCLARSEEQKWIGVRGALYPGQWVALQGSELLRHGPKARAVRDEARAKGVEHPLYNPFARRAGLAFRRLALMPRLEFSHKRSYGDVQGISLPAVLRNGGESVHVLAFVDTGASNCLFERACGELLNIEIDAGEPKTFWTATGKS
jgi:hypothetical protein